MEPLRNYIHSNPFTSQSVGSNTNVFDNISDLIQRLKVFLNCVFMRFSELKRIQISTFMKSSS